MFIIIKNSQKQMHETTQGFNRKVLVSEEYTAYPAAIHLAE